MQSRADNQDARWSALMAAAQGGDAARYNQLLHEITPFIRSLVRRSIQDSDFAEDVVQDVLLTVHRVRHTYEPARPFSPWLAAIASRRAIDLIRQRSRIGQHETVDEIAYETATDAAANQGEERLAVSEGQLRQWLQELPAGQRQALELLKLKELSLKEASAASGQSISSLKVSVHRAIKTLRARFGTQEE